MAVRCCKENTETRLQWEYTFDINYLPTVQSCSYLTDLVLFLSPERSGLDMTVIRQYLWLGGVAVHRFNGLHTILLHAKSHHLLNVKGNVKHIC